MVSFCLVLVLVLLAGLTDASVIKLFDKPHFYELSSNRDANLVHGSNFSQLFTTRVYGDGRCGPKTLIQYASDNNHDPAQGSEIGKLFMFTAKPVIYSNDEQTLSFLIDVQFQAPQITDIKGFEIGIEFEDHKSCVQVVPLGKMLNKPGRTVSYRLKIKDPVFMTIKQDKYTFYFGRASIKALIECEKGGSAETNQSSQMNLCAAENTVSTSVEIGILKVKDVDISYLKPDLCTGHLMTQTCILRYKPGDSHVIIMHPMPAQFDRVVADLDVMTYLDQFDSNTHLKLGERSLPDTKINYIESYHRQKMDNNIVFKFLNYPSDYLSYMSILKDPNSQSECHNASESHGSYLCECKHNCTECYDYPNPRRYLNYVLLSNDTESRLHMRSMHCTNEIYQAYSFESAGLEETFQNQRLDKPRLGDNSTSSFLPVHNKDSLPRLCFSFQSNKKSPADLAYGLKIFFNDVAKIAQSSIDSDSSSYKFTLYRYDFKEKPDPLGGLKLTKFFKIDARQLASVGSVNLTSGLMIPGLKQGRYLVEMTPQVKNSLCPGSDSCIDESKRNNHFVCVECLKLIVRFELFDGKNQKGVDADAKSAWASGFEQLEKKLKSTFSFGSQEKEVDVRIASDLDAFFESGDEYHCSQDSAEFEKILAQSYAFYASDDLSNRSRTDQSSEFRSKRAFAAEESNVDAHSQFGISAALVKKSFDIRHLMLPYETSYASEAVVESAYGDSLTKVFLLMSVIILMLILFIVFNIVYSRLRKQLVLNSFRKTVVFYLSVFVDDNTQKEMAEVAKIYEKFLKKWLPSAEVIIVSYDTKTCERDQLLNRADRIFYVCGTENEIRRLYDFLQIGQNAFHHDYYKLHFVNKFRFKCTNVTFNKNASVLFKARAPSSTGTCSVSNECCQSAYQFTHVLVNTPLKDNLQTIVNAGVIEARGILLHNTPQQKRALMMGQFERSVGCVMSPLKSKNSASSSQLSSASSSSSSNNFNVVYENFKQYIKLPTENKLLIKLILCDEFDGCGPNNPLAKYTNGMKLRKLALKLLLSRMEIEITKRVKAHFKNKKHLKTINKNINFNEQPVIKQSTAPEVDCVVFSGDLTTSIRYH